VLLGSLGGVSLMAQSTNVYSLNAVGYINVTVQPGFNIISDPLIASPDNTITTVLTNTGQFSKFQVWAWSPSTSSYAEAIGTKSGWGTSGNITLSPGQAAWLYNPGAAPTNITFVGTVPSGSLTNTLAPSSFNLVSSILPTSGDIVTNPLMNFHTAVSKDQVWTWDATAKAYTEEIAGKSGFLTHPIQATVGGGFWYFNATNTANNWVETFTVGQ